MSDNIWPLVLPDDDGIRPAGKTDRCFYCQQKVGCYHKTDCVTVKKKVRIKYTIEVDVTIPHHWGPEDLEFHRNEGSWCSSNLIHELERHDKDEGCLCSRVEAEFVSVIDDTPRQYKE